MVVIIFRTKNTKQSYSFNILKTRVGLTLLYDIFGHALTKLFIILFYILHVSSCNR